MEPSPVVAAVEEYSVLKFEELLQSIRAGAHGDFDPGKQAGIATRRGLFALTWLRLQSNCCHIW